MKIYLILPFLFSISFSIAQEDACDKCSMLREQYETAVTAQKEELYKFFAVQCLQTTKVFVTTDGKPVDSLKASGYQLISHGKCITYHEVRQFDKATKVETASFKIDKDTIYNFGTKTPQFPGGDFALLNYLKNNLQYPSRISEPPGSVYVKFIVRKNGSVTDVKVIRSASITFNEEAIRVVKAMPAWLPGEYRNNPVNMTYILPVKFLLR